MVGTRRDFIKALGGLAVLSAVPIPLSKALSLIQTTEQSYPIRYWCLEEAYQCCCYGIKEPDVMLLSPRNYPDFVEGIRKLSRFGVLARQGEDGLYGIAFNAAVVRPKPYVKQDHVWIINSKEDDPRYSGIFSMQETVERIGDVELDEEETW